MVAIPGLPANSINVVIRATDAFSGTFKRFNLGMGSFVRAGVVAGAAVALLAVGIGKVVSLTLDLEDAMVAVRKTTGLGAEETENLKNEFIGLSKVMPIAATDLANIGAVAGQLGIQGTENILAFTQTVAKMAIATELTEEEAGVALAKLANAFNLPITEVESLGSVINELSNTTAASAREIVSGLRRVGSSGTALGLSVDTVAALTATLIAAGTPAERAGTQLNNVFNNIIKNMSEVEAIVPGFGDKLRKDANGAVLELINTLGAMPDEIKRTQLSLDIFGSVGTKAITPLVSNIANLEANLKTSGDQMKEATSLQDEYDLALNSTRNQIQLLKNNFAAMALELGDTLVPIIRDNVIPALEFMLNVATSIINWWKNASPAIKIGTIVFIALAAAIGLVAAAIAIVTLVASPWLLIFLGVAAAVALIVVRVLGMIDLFKTVIIPFFKEKIVPVFKAVIEGIKSDWQDFKEFWASLWKGIVNVGISAWNFLIDGFELYVNSIIFALNLLVKAFNLASGVFGITIPEIPSVDFSGAKIEKFNDFIITSGGRIIQPHKDDTIIGTKNPGALGGGGGTMVININGDVFGTDPDQIADALGEKLRERINI